MRIIKRRHDIQSQPRHPHTLTAAHDDRDNPIDVIAAYSVSTPTLFYQPFQLRKSKIFILMSIFHSNP